MRIFHLFICFLFLMCSLEARENPRAKKRPKVCLNMIVKNEKDVICRCLESVKPLIDYWVIVDTGSTDGTQKIIKDFMKGIPGELYERPWVNFAHNRNEALRLGKDKADYLLFIDADDRFEINPNFVMPTLDKDGYTIDIHYSNLNYSRIQLIKTSLDWKWGGVVHEAIVPPPSAVCDRLDGVKMIIVGGGDRSADPRKFDKDIELLEAALQEDPGHARNMFYLAQSYRDAEKPELSLNAYEKRVAMGGWTEEVFWSLYQIGLIHESLEHSEPVIHYNYLRAYKYCPTRVEPLYRLANYYRRKENYLMGYLFSQFALQIPHVTGGLFSEKWMSEYGLLLEHSICAYWIGRYEEALQSSNQMLLIKNLPDHITECVKKNLTFIVPRLPNDIQCASKAG